MITGVTTAVILAAGLGSRLGGQLEDRPKGFLKFGERPIIEESVIRLLSAGIERIVIVTGHLARFYDALAGDYPNNIVTSHNPRYRESGSMYSLYCARDLLNEDFLLLESDLIYEQRALTAVMQPPAESCILVSGRTGAGDEVYVCAPEGRLTDMSKDLQQLEDKPLGELVGISRVNLDLFMHMQAYAAQAFQRSLRIDYETDCLVGVAPIYSIACRLVENLIWAEIDDPNHLTRSREVVYPAIAATDGARR